MKRTLALLTLAAALAPSAPAGAQQALLWVPADGAGLEEVVSALERAPDQKLTAALSSPPKALEERLQKLEKEGRLELAMRPAGDPPLPLLYYPASEEVKWPGKPSTAAMTTDQYFLSLRLSLAREAALKTFKKAPAGLVSPPGGLAADYFPIAKALGARWLACGPLASTAAAALESGGVYAVPFAAYSTSPAPSPAAGPVFTVFDETSSTDPAALRALLAAELGASVPFKRLTVSEALQAAASTQAAPAEISAAAAPWTGDYAAWAAAPLQAGALAALTQTRAALMSHLNAAGGVYAKAAPAFDEYFSAETGRGLAALASPEAETSAEAEIELRSTLANVFRLMGKAPPPWAFSSLADAAAAGSQADRIKHTPLPGGFELANVSRPAVPPGRTPRLPDSADPSRIWKLEGLRVSASEAGILFEFRPGALDNALKNASGFSHVRLDLYMDINHRPRAGMARPLDGRPFRLFPENAWEYALELSPAEAVLHKITPGGPVAAGRFKPSTENGWIKVLVPSSALRGTPALWSYAALMLAPKEGGGYSITDYLAEDIANGYIYAVRPGWK